MNEQQKQVSKQVVKSDRNVLLEQARQLCLHEQFTSAYQIYDQLLKWYPDDSAVLMDYGRAKFREFADLEQSAQFFHRVIEIEPNSVDAMLWLALVSWMGYGLDYEKAAALYQRVLELDPQNVDAYIGLGMLHGAPSSPITIQDAIGYYYKAIQVAPDNIDAHHNLAYALIEAGETVAAQEELLTTIKLLQTSGSSMAFPGKVVSPTSLAHDLEIKLERLRSGQALTGRAYVNSSSRFRWPE